MTLTQSHQLLAELTRASVLSAEQSTLVHAEIQRGATAAAALALHAHEREVWAHLASRAGLRYYATHQELRVLFTDLIDYRAALQHQLLPHRTRGHELQVLTHDPTSRHGPNPDFPGFHLRCALVTPSTWRSLYDLAYPATLTGPLDEAHATALVTLTPTGRASRATPEQRAEILALQRGHRYIDARRDPPDPSARDLVSVPTKVLCRAYPHHLEHGRLVVMMVDPQDPVALRRLQLQTQLPITAAVTTQGVIDALVTQDEHRQARAP